MEVLSLFRRLPNPRQRLSPRRLPSPQRLPSQRAVIAFAHDVIMAPVSFVAALWLRLGDGAGGYLADPDMLLALGLFTGVCAAVFWFMDLYRGIWRYASLPDLAAIGRAVTLALLIFLAITFLMTRLEALPRSFLIIDWFVLIFLLGAPRLAYRVLKDRGFTHVLESRRYNVPVLLVGAGDAAELFIRDTRRGGESAYDPVAILDEKGTRVGRRIHGVPVRGGLDDLEAVIADLRRRGKAPQRLILTRRLDRARMARLLDTAEANGMTLARLPRLTEFKEGPDAEGAEGSAEKGETPHRIEPRPIAVEDLLGRPQASLDRAAMARLVAGRRVLVTGAGGSIGGELVRQIAGFDPARLVLLDHAEHPLYSIDLEVSERTPALARRAVLADVRDAAGIDRLFAEEQPALVFHAAALKHVPLAEANPAAAVLTNVIGTRNVAEASRHHGVLAMVQISTDKAINPTGVMGATKRLAERYCQALDLAQRQAPPADAGGLRATPANAEGLRVVTVRFGNVLGSAGSVVPLFQRQIARGGPVTVTHPEMRRYFMTTREAVQLVLQASALGAAPEDTPEVTPETAPDTPPDGGESAGRIYVLDMGEPVRILDLARQVIRLAGLRPEKDIAIVTTAPRPGEKLAESLFHDGETAMATAHPGLRLAAARPADLALLDKGLDELARQARTGRVAEMISTLHRLVPEYQYPEAGVSTAPPSAVAS